jgi:predicted HTH transcriptional regulator
MALTHPLLHASPSEITIERVQALVRQTGPESPVVEYKEQFAATTAKGVAALANTYGGLLLIGVTDARIVKGVKEKTIESVAEHCHSTGPVSATCSRLATSVRRRRAPGT